MRGGDHRDYGVIMEMGFIIYQMLGFKSSALGVALMVVQVVQTRNRYTWWFWWFWNTCYNPMFTDGGDLFSKSCFLQVGGAIRRNNGVVVDCGKCR